MNEFEERLHTLKVEHKRNNVRLCEERNAKFREIDALIRQTGPELREVRAALREMKGMVKTDCHRRLSKAGRTYKYIHNSIMAEMAM